MEYRGFIIKYTKDVWPLYFGEKYYFEYDDKIIYCKTIEEAKEHIDIYIYKD